MNINNYPSDIFTRPDTDPTYRTLFCAVCIHAIDPAHLCERSAHAFHSLRSYIKSECTLSDKQFALLQSIKTEHDWRKRSDAIAKGRHTPNFNAYYRKLDSVFNPVGQ